MSRPMVEATGTLASLIEQDATLMWVVPIRRGVYVTICEDHSGGPASPHAVDCFVTIALATEEDTSDPAIDAVARWALHNATERWTEEGWGDHLPEVGEYDYDRIEERMTELLPRDVTFAEFEAAHKVLADRAETEI